MQTLLDDELLDNNSKNKIVWEGRENLVSASIDDANISKAPVMFPIFFVLSTSSS